MLFGTLKAERLVFANPMRDVKGGKLAFKIPASLTADEVGSVVRAPSQDPALRVVVALSGVHALPARQTRAMLLEQVDLPGRRLDFEDLNRPLDDYTAEAIGEYLAYRHHRWPNSTNPHLLVSRNTATTTTAVGTFWMDRLVKDLPVGVDRLRQGPHPGGGSCQRSGSTPPRARVLARCRNQPPLHDRRRLSRRARIPPMT
ncbi:hypothetical protein [Streptomyces sp. C10-9-1]|uniref:hypothetical protein n=1 Tax=Streptomyces sp. C10-9-1 TaxID=1859285 RepID=UPI003F4A820C